MRALAALLGVALALAAPAAAHPETPDCGLASDAGDSFDSASLVLRPVACTGELHSSWDSTDFFKFTCAMGGSATATLSSTGVVNLRAYLPVYTPRPLAWEATPGTASITFDCPIGGQYRVQLLHGGETPGLYDVPYSLSLG